MLQGLLSFQGRYKTLHLTWFAFFLTFVCWLNFAPFSSIVGKNLTLDKSQLATLGLCNIALTIPARIIIGMLLDKCGPRRTYSGLLIFALIPCLGTALSQDFHQLVISRLLMGIVGAGFVVGIRMVSEWFPPKEIGIAQGIYGGWGNFGSFGAEFLLPTIALGTAFLAGGTSNWRLAIALTGVIAAVYGVIYYNSVQDTPPGKTYKKPKRSGAMEVTSRRSFYAMLLMNFGLIFALGLISWRLMGVKFLDATGMYLVWILLAGLYAYQTYQAFQVNQDLLSGSKIYSTSERYQFRQVGLLGLAYAVTFGAELAAVSMLPGFLEDTFGLNHTNASIIAASYPFVNLISRPSGGLISDKLGNRKWTITALLLGVAIGYLLLQKINSGWSIPLTITLIMLAAFFAQACNGANFGMVPLIKKEVTGQIAGNVGAYGNFGAVIFLTIFSFNNASTLFTSIGISAIICASLCAFFLKEPQGSFAAHHADETAETLPQSKPPTLLDGKETY